MKYWKRIKSRALASLDCRSIWSQKSVFTLEILFLHQLCKLQRKQFASCSLIFFLFFSTDISFFSISLCPSLFLPHFSHIDFIAFLWHRLHFTGASWAKWFATCMMIAFHWFLSFSFISPSFPRWLARKLAK